MTTLKSTPAPAPDTTAREPLVPWRRALLPILVISAVLGLWGMFLWVTEGESGVGYGSYVPWGLWVAIYFHGVGVAAGAFAVTAVGHLAGVRGFRSGASLRIAAVLVAATVLPALLAVGLDLGHMERAWRIFLTPAFTSMMAFNSWMYIALLATAGVVWWLSFRPGSTWLRPVLVLGVLISLMVPGQSGAFFGVVDANPFWHSALLPVMLLVSALVAGAAALMVVRALLGDAPMARVEDDPGEALAAVSVLRRVVLWGLVVYFVMEFAEFSIALWSTQSTAPEISLILTGPYWWVFWLIHLALGGVVAAALLLTRKPSLWVVAGVIVAVTFISSRLNILIPGQSTSEIVGLQEAFYHPRLDFVYTATLQEYLVSFFILALGMAVFYVGLRITAAVEQSVSRKENA